MPIRLWFMMVLALGVAVVLVIEYRILYGTPDPDSDQREFFVDEITMVPETHTAGEIPPLRGSSGELTVVYARYFDIGGTPALAWLQRYDAETRQKLLEAKSKGALTAEIAMASAMGAEVRRPIPGSPWIKPGSKEGQRVCTPPRLPDGNYASMMRPGQDVAQREFFVDENTLAFEKRLATDVPPLTGKTGEPTVVIARCFTIDGKRAIAWLQRYNEKSQRTLTEAQSLNLLTADIAMSANNGLEVRLPTAGSSWVLASSPEGKAITKAPQQTDGNFAPMSKP